MEKEKLYMIMLGCKPGGRLTEQHDIFFGIAKSLKELVPQIKNFWPEANGKIHVDAWRIVKSVGDFEIEVQRNKTRILTDSVQKLYFFNLGGYKRGEFEEFHYKILTVADSLSEATKRAKESAFYKHCTFVGAVSHIDDKYGIDIDDVYNVADILHRDFTKDFHLQISQNTAGAEDELHIGYLPISKIK